MQARVWACVLGAAPGFSDVREKKGQRGPCGSSVDQVSHLAELVGFQPSPGI